MGKRRYDSTAVRFPNGNDLNQRKSAICKLFPRRRGRTHVRACAWARARGRLRARRVPQRARLSPAAPAFQHYTIIPKFHRFIIMEIIAIILIIVIGSILNEVTRANRPNRKK